MTAPQHRPHTRYLPVLALLTALVVLAVWVLVARLGHDDSDAAASPSVRPDGPSGTSTTAKPTPGRTPSSPTPTASPQTSRAPSADEQYATAKAALAKMIKDEPSGGVAISALNTKTGRSLTMGSSQGIWTASSYKLLMTEILLYQHAKNGTFLSDAEDADVTTALENSDNVAGYQLWIDVGRNPGQQSGMRALGLEHSSIGQSDPAFTQLAASDGVTLLKNLVSSDSPLSKSARTYVLGKLADVEPDQRWGVGAAADKGTQFYNKNGWLSIDNANGPGERDDGLWAVTSLGIVTVNGQQVLMAVLTRHQSDFDTGRKLVEKLSRSLADAVAPQS